MSREPLNLTVRQEIKVVLLVIGATLFTAIPFEGWNYILINGSTLWGVVLSIVAIFLSGAYLQSTGKIKKPTFENFALFLIAVGVLASSGLYLLNLI